jgi:outer membrane protein assembly factor BamB
MCLNSDFLWAAYWIKWQAVLRGRDYSSLPQQKKAKNDLRREREYDNLQGCLPSEPYHASPDHEETAMRKLVIAFGVFLTFGLAVLLSRQASASPWPRFRGPNGTGIAADKDIPVRWTEQDGLLWKVPVPGVGHSSPVVWGDRVFVQSASADGKERLLLCFSTVNGKTLWSRSVPGAPAHAHQFNSLASSTPATDGQRVYAAFWDGKAVWIYAYDLQGHEVWKQKLGGFVSQHGVGTSPMVYRDKVFLAHDQDGAADLIALDARTGKPAWKSPRRPFRASYSTPLILERPGTDPELIVASTAGLTSYSPESGSENWDFSWTFDGNPLRTVASPVFGQDRLFISSGEGGGARHAVAVKASGKGDVSKTNLVWEKKRDFPYVPTMLLSGDYLYLVNDLGIAACHLAATGEKVWDQRLGGSVFASPILIDGKIYAVNDNGTVFVFPAAPTFKLLAKNSVGESVKATPAVADNRLFIRGIHHLFCIGKTPEKQASAR